MEFPEYLKKEIPTVLSKANVSVFPEKETSETEMWVRAIALARTADGNHTLVLLTRQPNMEYAITYNGAQSPVREFVEFYPYELLNKKYIRGFKGNAAEPRIEYLRSLNLPYAEGVDYSAMSVSELNKAIVGAAVYMQINNK